LDTLHESLGFWRPGIGLARKARFPVKLGGMAVVVLLPVLVAAVLLLVASRRPSMPPVPRSKGW